MIRTLLLHIICDVEVSDVDVVGPFSAALPAIFFKLDGAHVVLEKGGGGAVALRCKEEAFP